MDFSGPQKAEFNNVRSLNLAFLDSLRTSPDAAVLLEAFSPKLRPLVSGLTDLQSRRLAETPFLLLSLREQDDDYWSVLFADDPNGDLFAVGPTGGRDRHLAAAALGFLWQLAQHNPYAVRLVSGATINWCERLANCTLLRLLQRTADRTDLLRPRIGTWYSNSSTFVRVAVDVDDRSCGAVSRRSGSGVQDTTSCTSRCRKTRSVLTASFRDGVRAAWVQ